ncbi:MAG: hypothetical protein IKX31_09290 [Muribaculaceae bacterium]|nr:hypothetical protein [Muribaculaceae bacterium]
MTTKILALLCTLFAFHNEAENITPQCSCGSDCSCIEVCTCSTDMAQDALEMPLATMDREAGKCSCGGSLKFSAKAFATVVTCTLCKGNKVYGGEVCTLCNGSGSITYYSSGYICEKCGNKYDKWEP